MLMNLNDIDADANFYNSTKLCFIEYKSKQEVALMGKEGKIDEW